MIDFSVEVRNETDSLVDWVQVARKINTSGIEPRSRWNLRIDEKKWVILDNIDDGQTVPVVHVYQLFKRNSGPADGWFIPDTTELCMYFRLTNHTKKLTRFDITLQFM